MKIQNLGLESLKDFAEDVIKQLHIDVVNVTQLEPTIADEDKYLVIDVNTDSREAAKQIEEKINESRRQRKWSNVLVFSGDKEEYLPHPEVIVSKNGNSIKFAIYRNIINRELAGAVIDITFFVRGIT